MANWPTISGPTALDIPSPMKIMKINGDNAEFLTQKMEVKDAAKRTGTI